MDNQDSFMKLIIDETYQEDVGEASPINLVNYFEKRLNEVDFLSLKTYLSNENILSLPLVFNEQTKCYRIILGNTEIDFPSNWSIFSKLNDENLVHVRATSDEDYLCEIFLSYVGDVSILVLATESNESHLIFLRAENADQQLFWIENYFIKQKELQIKKAA